MGRQGTHITTGLLHLKVFGQIDERLDCDLVLRAGTYGRARGRGIQAAWPPFQIHVEIRIRTLQAPPVRWSPIRTDFHSGGTTQHAVAEEERDNKMRRRRRSLDKGRAGFDALDASVVVIKRRHIHREFERAEAPESGVIADQPPRREMPVAKDAGKDQWICADVASSLE